MLDEETSIQLFKKGEGSNGGVLTGRNCKQNCKLCSAAGGAVLQSRRARAAEPGRAKNRVAGPVPGTLGQTDEHGWRAGSAVVHSGEKLLCKTHVLLTFV